MIEFNFYHSIFAALKNQIMEDVILLKQKEQTISEVCAELYKEAKDKGERLSFDDMEDLVLMAKMKCEKTGKTVDKETIMKILNR